MRIPLGMAAALAVIALLGAWYAANWLVQAVRKPSEIAGLFEGGRFKSPRATWEAYGDLFREHATGTITPELLAAMAQVESEGNPIARTYWRWRWTLHPFRAYAPASSAAGMFQITDGAFEACRRLCIHGGRVARDGPWHDLRSCWFNAFYNRLIPGHAVEMTSACLDEDVARILEGAARRATREQMQDLAPMIHLCGAGAGRDYARRGFRLAPGQRCADQDPRAYLAKVRRLRQAFARLARRS